MAQIDMPHERLSDYERAICYYTLPKITHPVTLGLIVVYLVCVIEAAGVLLYGFLSDNARITQIGAVAFGGIIIFGIVIFLLRALIYEIRLRRALAVAKGVPNAIEDMGDIPDPFVDHVLLRHPLHARGDLYPCTDNTGALAYFVESAPNSPWWKVKDPQDNEVLRVHACGGAGSFSLLEDVPRRLSVYVGGKEIAQIRRPFSLTSPAIQITCLTPDPREYVVQRGGIFRDKRLVGRVYFLHRSVYLDIERKEFHEAILGLFITMT